MKKHKFISYAKNENGITLSVLVITIIIMLILASVSIGVGKNSLDSTKLQGFYTQLEIIQKRVDDIASTNESYVDASGNTVYLKNQGRSLSSSQQSNLQNIMLTENISYTTTNFKYFTIQDLEDILDLMEMEYNVFIDFENRIVIAERGIDIGNKTYHVLKNTTYYIKQDNTENTETFSSLSYKVTQYGDDKYKITINTNNDKTKLDNIKFKETTTKYWEIQSSNEIIVKPSTEYDIIYEDINKNKVEKKIKVNSNTDR